MTTPALTRTHVIYGALLFGIGLLYLLLARPHVTGFEYDDGAYLLAAKALANGQGYVLPYTHPLQALVKYPPLTSIIMTPLWWLPVEFPANVMLFKGLNILLTLTFLGMLGYYAERVIKLPRWQSLCVVGLVGCHPQLTHVATEILSEPLYLVLSMGLFLLSVRCHSGNGALKTDREGSFATTGMLLAGVLLLLAVLAYYARTVGIILVGALGLWLFVSHRKKHALLAWFFGFGLCALWMLWTSAQADFTTPLSLNGREWVLRTLNESYLTSIKTDLLYHYTWIDLYSSGLAALYGKWSIELFPFLSLLPSWVALASGFGLLGLFLLLGLKHLKQKQWSLPGIYVTLYLGILPFWAYHDQYPRFLIVILPFLWLWLFQLANKAHRKLPSKTPHIVIPVLVLAISICNLIPNGFRIVFDRGNAITFKNKPPVWVDFIATTDAIKQRQIPYCG